MLHFWLSCIIKSFWDSATFIGTNKTGIAYDIFVGGLSVFLLIRQHVRQHGWARLATGGVRLVGQGIFIGFGAFILVWIGHLIAAPFGLYTEAEARAQQAAEGYKRHIRNIDTQFNNEKEELSRQVSTFTSQVTEMKADCALKDGIAKTLEKQNRDQQASINSCLSQAIKLITPEGLRTATFPLGRSTVPIRPRPGRQRTGADSKPQTIEVTNYLLLTNRPVIPTRVLVSCDANIRSASGQILFQEGVQSMSLSNAGSGRISDTEYLVGVTPEWTPFDPLIISVDAEGAKRCSFTPK